MKGGRKGQTHKVHPDNKKSSPLTSTLFTLVLINVCSLPSAHQASVHTMPLLLWGKTTLHSHTHTRTDSGMSVCVSDDLTILFSNNLFNSPQNYFWSTFQFHLKTVHDLLLLFFHQLVLFFCSVSSYFMGDFLFLCPFSHKLLLLLTSITILWRFSIFTIHKLFFMSFYLQLRFHSIPPLPRLLKFLYRIMSLNAYALYNC